MQFFDEDYDSGCGGMQPQIIKVLFGYRYAVPEALINMATSNRSCSSNSRKDESGGSATHVGAGALTRPAERSSAGFALKSLMASTEASSAGLLRNRFCHRPGCARPDSRAAVPMWIIVGLALLTVLGLARDKAHLVALFAPRAEKIQQSRIASVAHGARESVADHQDAKSLVRRRFFRRE